MKYSKILLCFGALWASSAFPAPAPCDTLRVAFLTDIHVTPGNVQDSLFRVAVDEINASPCDIVIFGGDLTNLGSDAELEYVHGLISRLEKPWHAVPGNHETTWSESACTTFARIFGHDGRTAFRAGDYLFLGYASGPFMKMAMGAVRTEDLAWLAAEAAKARPGQRIVSLCHYPLNNDLTNRTEVTATLRRLDIPLTLFGHYHRAPSLFNFDSIAGIQGRALRGKSDSDAGYTLLDFWGDSVRVREKTLGAEPRTRFTIRMQDDPRTLALASDPTPPVPDYKAHAQLVLQDSATIYTGAAFYKDLVYYGTTQGVLRAYDTRRNREVWRQRFGGALYTTPLVAEGLIIAGTTTDGLRAARGGISTPRRRSSGRDSSTAAAAARRSTSGWATARWPKSRCATGGFCGVTTTAAASRRDSPRWRTGNWFSEHGTGIFTASTPRRENSAGSGPTARKASSCPRATSFPGSPEAACSSTRPTAPSPASTSPREASYGAAPTTRPAKHRA